MKKEIDLKQWNELSLKQKRIFLDDKDADGTKNEFEHLERTGGWFEIGELIEFLLPNFIIMPEAEKFKLEWDADKELIDVLWDIVKNKLNKYYE